MPQDSGPDSDEPTEITAAARRLMDEAAADQIPENIRKLADKLQSALDGRRKPDGKKKSD